MFLVYEVLIAILIKFTEISWKGILKEFGPVVTIHQ